MSLMKEEQSQGVKGREEGEKVQYAMLVDTISSLLPEEPCFFLFSIIFLPHLHFFCVLFLIA